MARAKREVKRERVVRKSMEEFPDFEVVENRRGLMHRLVREGVWREASAFKDEAIREARRRYEGGAGVRADPRIVEWAWSEMERAFPPKGEQGEEGENGGSSLQQTTEGRRRAVEVVEEGLGAVEVVGGEGGEGSGAVGERGRVQGLSRYPVEWDPLPESASVDRDIEWVRSNRPAVVSETGRGGYVVDFWKAHSPMPAHSTMSMLEFAIANPTKFMELALKKKVEEAGESEELKRERKGIEEIGEILGRIEAALVAKGEVG